jgi:hypothetical protein
VVTKAKVAPARDRSRWSFAPRTAVKSNAPSSPGPDQFIGRRCKCHGRLFRDR